LSGDIRGGGGTYCGRVSRAARLVVSPFNRILFRGGSHLIILTGDKCCRFPRKNELVGGFIIGRGGVDTGVGV